MSAGNGTSARPSGSLAQALAPLRQALRPQGTLDVTLLRLKAGCAVDASLVQEAIDEIEKYLTIGRALGEPEPACMKLTKILLMDSSYLS
jgi:hypothetical protein